MRSLAKLTRLLPIVFVLLFACQPEEEPLMVDNTEQEDIENFIQDAENLLLDPSARIAEEIIPCNEGQIIPLRAYRHSNVGNVSVTNSEEHLMVGFESAPEYSLHKTVLVLMIENQSVDSDTWYFRRYRKLILPVDHEHGLTSYTYEIPFDDLGLTGEECMSMIAFAYLNSGDYSRFSRKIFALAKPEKPEDSGIFSRYFIDYCMQQCIEEKSVDDATCTVNCNYGFAIPSVDVDKSYSFADMEIEDWTWGYAHKIKDETMFRLPIKKEDSETAPIIGQMTVMISGDIAYVYFQMNDGYPMNKVSLYFNGTEPESGIPCGYTYQTDFTNPDGTWKPTLSHNYQIDDLSLLLGAKDSDDGVDVDKFWIIGYVDFCEQ